MTPECKVFCIASWVSFLLFYSCGWLINNNWLFLFQSWAVYKLQFNIFCLRYKDQSYEKETQMIILKELKNGEKVSLCALVWHFISYIFNILYIGHFLLNLIWKSRRQSRIKTRNSQWLTLQTIRRVIKQWLPAT